MKLEISDEIVAEGVARGVERYLSGTQLAEQIADCILAQVQFLDPEQAAAVLKMPERTFSTKVNEDRLLSKVTVMGSRHPRYLLSEIVDRARQSVVKRLGMKQGEEPKIYGLPKPGKAA